jgi:hypothetical protein
MIEFKFNSFGLSAGLLFLAAADATRCRESNAFRPFFRSNVIMSIRVRRPLMQNTCAFGGSEIFILGFRYKPDFSAVPTIRNYKVPGHRLALDGGTATLLGGRI